MVYTFLLLSLVSNSEEVNNANKLDFSTKVFNKKITNSAKTKSFVTVSTPQNTIEVVDFKIFNPPLLLEGDKITNLNSQNKSILTKAWWRTYQAISTLELFKDYASIRPFISDSYAEAMTEKNFKLTKNAITGKKLSRKRKKSVGYYFHYKYLGKEYVFVGAVQRKHLSKDEFPENWGGVFVDLIDNKWVIDFIDYDSLAMQLKLTYPMLLENYIQKKVVYLNYDNNGKCFGVEPIDAKQNLVPSESRKEQWLKTK